MTAAVQPYLKDPAAIYAQSFATVRSQADLVGVPDNLIDVAIRLVHACGTPDVLGDMQASAEFPGAARGALDRGASIFCDCEMVASGITRKFLTAGNDVVVTLNNPTVPDLAAEMQTTRSAAAVELWKERLEGALVVIGNAPTALFRLLEIIDEGGPRPAAIIGIPVGFVGAAESKLELASEDRSVPFLAVHGTRGGSAMASSVVNAVATSEQIKLSETVGP